MTFDKDKFLRANQRNQENAQFQKIDEGFYICDLIEANMNPSKSSGRNQALFQWQIDSESPMFPNKFIFQTIGLDGDTPEKQDEQYKILDIVLRKLGVNDIEGFANDSNGYMQKLIGTKARLRVSHKDEFTQVRVMNVIESSLNFDAPSATTNEQTTANDDVNFTIGAQATITVPDGQRLATIKAYHRQTNKVMVEYAKDKAIDYVDPSQVQEHKPGEIIEEVEELVEEVPTEEESVTLELGMNVKGNFNGKPITGTIYAFSEDQTKVKIKEGNKVYSCPLESIELV